MIVLIECNIVDIYLLYVGFTDYSFLRKTYIISSEKKYVDRGSTYLKNLKNTL